jgi:hypothetical protein
MSIERGPGRPTKYVLKDGARVPGVTTITGRWKDSGGLIHWAWQQGIDGIDYRKTRDSAADAGSIAHDMIEAHIHNEVYKAPPGTDPAVIVKATRALDNFRKWAEQTRLNVLATELPFVSEKHRFGGTLDALGEVMGSLALLDWKSSAGVYADYLAQVAAYVILYEENRPGRSVEAIHLLRFDKECDTFAHHQWGGGVIENAKKFFLLGRELYDIDQRLKKAAA